MKRSYHLLVEPAERFAPEVAADNLYAADCDSEQADHGKSDQEGARQSDEDDQAGDQQRARTDSKRS